jgi:Flp pilus assembly pilin Flp
MGYKTAPDQDQDQEYHMFTKLKNRLLALHKDDQGAMSVEMILILAVVGIPILIAIYAFVKWIIGRFNQGATDLETQTQTPTP